MSTAVHCLISYVIVSTVHFVTFWLQWRLSNYKSQDAGIGSNATLYKEAQNNSHGYRMYEDGIERGIFVKNASGQPLVGQVQ